MNEQERAAILVVDDVPANVQILNNLLKDDYEIFFATSGADALRLAGRRAFDLILLDIMMPGMDGYEVCERLKASPDTADVPVIFVTAMGEVEDETRGLELGAVDYITKPVSPPIVRARVRNHVRLKRQADLLRNLSRLDGLTGIANRRRFDEALELEWRRCARSGEPVSLLMMDVDHFKQLNDRFGHLAGDDTLRGLAAAIAGQNRRAGDLVARYGGEEFVCLLPGTGSEGALALGESIREAVAGADILDVDGKRQPVTISIGVATLVPASKESPQRLVAVADTALYQAKQQGRNRVIVAGETRE